MKGMSIFTILDSEQQENLGWGHEVCCPICGQSYQHMQEPKIEKGNDNYEADWGGRGDMIRVPFKGECGHEWSIGIGFHKGNTHLFTLVDEEDYFSLMFSSMGKGKFYYKYIQSDMWREKADAAKERVGHRCQVCNGAREDGIALDAHHRTYERLGHELPEDITVLCRDCHGLYEKNKKTAQVEA